jgi:hypothetical protein
MMNIYLSLLTLSAEALLKQGIFVSLVCLLAELLQTMLDSPCQIGASSTTQAHATIAVF